MAKKYLKLTGIILAVGILCFWGYYEYKEYKNKNSATLAKETVSVIKAEPVFLQNITTAKNFVGQVTAINKVSIVPYISGYVTNIFAKGGQRIKKGDILFVIQPDEYQASLMQAKANILSADATFINAKSNYERMKNAGDKAISQSEMESAYTQYITAKAQVKNAQANYQIALTNLQYTVLTAPFDGVIGNIGISVGDYITPQTENIASIVQYNPIRVVFSITDKEYLLYNKKSFNFANEKIKLILADGSTYAEEGKVEYTENSVNKNTNSLAVYAKFTNKNRKLLPNSYVKVLVERNYQNVVLIDKNLLQFREDGNFIYVIINNELQLKPIRIVGENNNQYILADSFNENELLVTETANERLIGQKVQPNISKTEEK